MDTHQPEQLLSAVCIDHEMAKQYFTVMREIPEHAWRFYAKHGHHQTVYEDGTVVVAENRIEICDMLMHQSSADRDVICVDSVITVPYGSMDRLAVTASGQGFLQTFIIEYQNSYIQSYAIVVSITRFYPIQPTADNETQSPAQTVNSRVNISDDITDKPPVQLPYRLSGHSTPNTVPQNPPAESVDKPSAKTPASQSPPKSLRTNSPITAAQQPRAGTRLFVGNIPSAKTEKELTTVFGVHGPVTNVQIMKYKNTTPYQSAFIQFYHLESATKALEHQPYYIDGCLLDVMV